MAIFGLCPLDLAAAAQHVTDGRKVPLKVNIDHRPLNRDDGACSDIGIARRYRHSIILECDNQEVEVLEDAPVRTTPAFSPLDHKTSRKISSNESILMFYPILLKSFRFEPDQEFMEK